MWRFIKQNQSAVIFAVVVHLVFVGILVFSFNFSSSRVSVNPDVKIVKATVIDEAKIKKEQERKRQEALKRKQEQQRKKLEAKKQAELKKKREQEKKLALKKKREAEKKRKAEQEKKQQLQARREAEEQRKKKEEADRKAREADLKKQMAQAEAEEQRQRQLAEQAARKREAQQGEIDKYQALIRQSITNRWTVPVSAKIGQECTLRLRLLPTGEVISVEIIKSSGDRVFDRSVEAAVFKASPLPLPPAESGLFDEFREIIMPFRLEKRS